MRAFRRDQERDLRRTRKLLMELRNGNPNIKKSGKYRKESDIFYLETIDGKVLPIEVFRITKQQAETANKRGYTVPSAFIKN